MPGQHAEMYDVLKFPSNDLVDLFDPNYVEPDQKLQDDDASDAPPKKQRQLANGRRNIQVRIIQHITSFLPFTIITVSGKD